ncbi:MAG TPA: bifunctional phosphopantothenoylcysteine decarboxylase/phosphopantothenate--cysteine ligase CoaBC, partial [Luteitalea sp.]|nr:bifunctional phosphopantothenoylcysteine decarboxylase/phosphopantothenate--cysteine ligase CoaBC [Luteitalea sp.]
MALVAVGVSGGISAYKAVEVVRQLQKAGHQVAVVMTRAATRFVGPLTFEAITQRRVITSQWAPGANADIEHIALASEAALLLIAPATANTLAKLAHGVASDFLSSLALATRAPVLVAPAMNTHMYDHPATQANMALLRSRGVRFVEPGEGYLACGWVGKGRLAEPDVIAREALSIIESPQRLRGRRVLVTAGPTYEDLDPVRYLGNRSSGRMGIAVAVEAARQGADVTLVLGPTDVEPPAAVRTIRVRAAREMHAAVVAERAMADAIVMSAAVADYTPAGGAAVDKVKKQDGALTVTLERTVDILADLGRWRGDRTSPVLVGFAAETTDVLAYAETKRQAKRVDLIVANDVGQPGAGFGVDTN